MDTQEKVSVQEKSVVCSRLLCIAKTADCYSEDKKILKKLLCVVKREKKTHRKSSYPLTEAHSSELEELISMLLRALSRLSKVRSLMDYKEGTKALYEVIEALQSQIKECNAETEEYAAEAVAAAESKKKTKDGNLK